MKYEIIKLFTFALIGNFTSAQNLTSGLVAWYPFDGNASDMSGNGNDGTVYGATLGEDRNGEAGKAYAFDNNAYIVVPHDPLIDFNTTDPHTLSVWIKPENDSPSGSIISKWYNSYDPYPYTIRFNSDSFAISANIYTGGYPQISSNVLSTVSPLPEYLNGYGHVCAVFYPSEVKLFIDGEFLSSKQSELTSFNSSNSHSMFIGKRDGRSDRYFKGSIDDIRIYNRALSEPEVQALYELEKPIDTDGDGLLDYEEIVTYGTDPNDADSDDDGFIDGTEVNYGANPLSSDKAILDMITAEPSIYGFVTQKDYDDLFYSQETNSTPYTPSWFYVPSRGWIWTNHSSYPYFYDAEDKDWMYFQSGEEKPKFYRYKTKTWLTIE